MSPVQWIALIYSLGILSQSFLNASVVLLFVMSFGLLLTCLFFIKSRGFFPVFLLVVFLLAGAWFTLRGGENPPRAAHENAKEAFVTLAAGKLNGISSAMLPKPYSNILGSLVLGSSASPPPAQIKDAYRKVGLIHLLVASGQQVSILFGFIMAVCRTLNIPKKLSSIGAIGLGFLFSLIAGAGPSIMRAFLMSSMALSAPLFDRESDPLSGLTFSALVLLLIDPTLLLNIGFQLSFAATFSLLCLAPVIEGALPRNTNKVISASISISSAPFLMTMPIILYNFSQVSLVSPLVNAIVLFFIELLVVLGFIALSVGLVLPPAALLFSGALFALIRALNFVVFFFAALPFSSLNIKPPSIVIVLCYYAVLALGVNALKDRATHKLKRNTLVIAGLFVALVFAINFASASPPLLKGEILKVTVIDVGQGDSIFIRTPGGKSLLLDGGDRYSGRGRVVPFLKKNGINKLDYVALSHPHSDHVGGLAGVLENFSVDAALDAGQAHPSKFYIDFLAQIKSKGIKYRTLSAGDVLMLDKGVTLEVLWPAESSLKPGTFDLNNNSIVFRVVYHDFSMLLPGDLGGGGEGELVKSGAVIKSDVLKAGHHGSNTSSTKEFLRKVDPKIAIISVGKENRFGHPGGDAILRIENIGARVWRTDASGDVEVISNGQKYVIYAR